MTAVHVHICIGNHKPDNTSYNTPPYSYGLCAACGSKLPALSAWCVCMFRGRTIQTVEGNILLLVVRTADEFEAESSNTVRVANGGRFPRPIYCNHHHHGPEPEQLRVLHFVIDRREPVGRVDRQPELLRLRGRRVSRGGGSVVRRPSRRALMDVSTSEDSRRLLLL